MEAGGLLHHRHKCWNKRTYGNRHVNYLTRYLTEFLFRSDWVKRDEGSILFASNPRPVTFLMMPARRLTNYGTSSGLPFLGDSGARCSGS